MQFCPGKKTGVLPGADKRNDLFANAKLREGKRTKSSEPLWRQAISGFAGEGQGRGRSALSAPRKPGKMARISNQWPKHP